MFPAHSLQFRPCGRITVGVDLDMDDIRLAAHRAVLHILLLLALRNVDRHNDLFATGAAEVSRFVVHGSAGLGARVVGLETVASRCCLNDQTDSTPRSWLPALRVYRG